MSNVDIFDDYIRTAKLGTRLIGSSLPQQAADEYNRYIRRVCSFIDSARSGLPRLTPVYAEFVQNPAFNARAVPYGGIHLIVLFDGLPVIVSTVVRRMLADRRTFLRVGDPSAETGNLPPYARFKPNASELMRSIASVTPRSTQRQIYAYHLQNIAFDFIAAHELTHIAHGHVTYMNAEKGQPFLGEMEWMPGTPEGNLESQTMEMDADFNAAKLLVQTIDRLVRNHSQLGPPSNEFYRDRAQSIYDAAAAICIMCRLFGDGSLTGVDLTKIRHPPMRWRQMWILNTVGNYVEHLWGESFVQPATDALTRAIAEVEEAFELITDGLQKVEGLHDAWGPAGRAFAKRLADCWNDSLKAKLARHAFVEAMPHYGFDFPEA
jgi:hypothetical protein